jgi:hypothetical protein
MLSIYFSTCFLIALHLYAWCLHVIMSLCFSIYFSTCFVIALRLYAYCLHFIMSLCLLVFSFSMQVIEQYEPRQGKLLVPD